MNDLMMTCRTRFPLENREDIGKGTIRLSAKRFAAGERILGVWGDRTLFLLYVEPIDETNVSDWKRIIDTYKPTIVNNTNTQDVSGHDILWKDYKSICGTVRPREGDIVVTKDGAYIVSSTKFHPLFPIDYHPVVFVCDELPNIQEMYKGALVYSEKINICTELNVRVFLSSNPQIICVNGSRPFFSTRVIDLPYMETEMCVPGYTDLILCGNDLYKIDAVGETYMERFMNLRNSLLVQRFYIRSKYRSK